MEQNFAAWMINGGTRAEGPHAARDREHLRAFLDGRREARAAQPGLIARIRESVRPTPVRPDPACCPA
jgi:hypothetical protein